MTNRRITKTTRTFSGPTYAVAGDPVPTGFNTPEGAEQRAAQLDTADAVDQARRGVTRTHT
jgi:hypothetical protein